jgi:hypothetical protein
MTRLRAGYIAVIASLTLASGACAEPAAGGSAYEDCMVQKTKAACDLSEEACTRFLSESGQRHAIRACQQAERSAEPQPVAPADHQQPPAQRNAHSQPAASAEPQPVASVEQQPPALGNAHSQPAAAAEQQPPAGRRMRYRPANALQAETQPENARPLSQKKPVPPAEHQQPPAQRNVRSQPADPPRMDENLRPQPSKKRQQPQQLQQVQQQAPEQQQKKAARPAGDEPFWSRGGQPGSETERGASDGQR